VRGEESGLDRFEGGGVEDLGDERGERKVS